MKTPKRELSYVETFICVLSFIVGGFLVYMSAHFIYRYHFTNSLWLVMLPMTDLVSELVLGISLLVSVGYLFLNKRKAALLYRLSGILIILYPINLNLLEFFRGCWYTQSLLFFIFLPMGLFLYLFFNRKKYREDGKTCNMTLIAIGLAVYLLIDIVFYNWNYSLVKQFLLVFRI